MKIPELALLEKKLKIHETSKRGFENALQYYFRVT